jgi:hypothetical protein
VSSAGPDIAQNIELRVRPEPLEPLGTFELDPAHTSPACSLGDDEIVRCPLFSVLPEQVITVRIVLSCEDGAATLHSTADVTTTARDPSPANNSSADVPVSCS